MARPKRAPKIELFVDVKEAKATISKAPMMITLNKVNIQYSLRRDRQLKSAYFRHTKRYHSMAFSIFGFPFLIRTSELPPEIQKRENAMDWSFLVWRRYADFNGRSRRKEYW